MRTKSIVKVITSITLCMCMLLMSIAPTYAWSDTNSKSAYSYYYKKSMGTLEARIWVSQLSTNWSKTKVTFDATSSSWVFNASKTITGHVNALTLEKTGLTGDLSISKSEVGVSVTEKTDSLCTLETKAANSYYRGLTTYNNTVTRGVVGTLFALTIGGPLANVVITGTSTQSVYLDGQMFTNTATTTAYF